MDDNDFFNPENAYNHALKRRWRTMPSGEIRHVDPDEYEFQAACEAMREVDDEIEQRRRRLEAKDFLENL